MDKYKGMENAVFPFVIQLFVFSCFWCFFSYWFNNKFLILEADVPYEHFNVPFQLELRG